MQNASRIRGDMQIPSYNCRCHAIGTAPVIPRHEVSPTDSKSVQGSRLMERTNKITRKLSPVYLGNYSSNAAFSLPSPPFWEFYKPIFPSLSFFSSFRLFRGNLLDLGSFDIVRKGLHQERRSSTFNTSFVVILHWKEKKKKRDLSLWYERGTNQFQIITPYSGFGLRQYIVVNF